MCWWVNVWRRCAEWGWVGSVGQAVKGGWGTSTLVLLAETRFGPCCTTARILGRPACITCDTHLQSVQPKLFIHLPIHCCSSPEVASNPLVAVLVTSAASCCCPKVLQVLPGCGSSSDRERCTGEGKQPGKQ